MDQELASCARNDRVLIRTPVNSMAIAEVIMPIPAMGNVCGHLLATLLGCRLMFRFSKEKRRTTAEYLTDIRHRRRMFFLFLPSVAAIRSSYVTRQ